MDENESESESDDAEDEKVEQSRLQLFSIKEPVILPDSNPELERQMREVELRPETERQRDERMAELKNKETELSKVKIKQKEANENNRNMVRDIINAVLSSDGYPQYRTPERIAELTYALQHGGRPKRDEGIQDRNLRILNNLRKKWDAEDYERALRTPK